MHYLVATIQHKSKAVIRDSRLLETIRIGLRPGHSRARDFSIMIRRCKTQQKTKRTQPSSTLAAHSCPYHQTFSASFRMSGRNRSQVSIAKVLSAIPSRPATRLRAYSTQWPSNSVTTSSRWEQKHTSIRMMRKTDVTFSFIDALYQARMQTCSLSEMCSCVISTPCTISKKTK